LLVALQRQPVLDRRTQLVGLGGVLGPARVIELTVDEGQQGFAFIRQFPREVHVEDRSKISVERLSGLGVGSRAEELELLHLAPEALLHFVLEPLEQHRAQQEHRPDRRHHQQDAADREDAYTDAAQPAQRPAGRTGHRRQARTKRPQTRTLHPPCRHADLRANSTASSCIVSRSPTVSGP